MKDVVAVRWLGAFPTNPINALEARFKLTISEGTNAHSFQQIQLTHWKRAVIDLNPSKARVMFPTNPINALEAREQQAALRNLLQRGVSNKSN